jgi:hypothetical protein
LGSRSDKYHLMAKVDLEHITYNFNSNLSTSD